MKKIRHIKKGEIIQYPGDTKLKAFLVVSGLLKSYSIDSKGKEHIFMFAPENWLILDVELFKKNGEAILFIEAIENSEIEIVNSEVFDNKENLPKELLSGQIDSLINRLITIQKRVLLLLSANSKERYNEFITTYPNIAQRVPQKMIASYLGVTPEALSTLRNNK